MTSPRENWFKSAVLDMERGAVSGLKYGATAWGIAGASLAAFCVVHAYLHGSGSLTSSLTDIWSLAGILGVLTAYLGGGAAFAGGVIGLVAGLMVGVLTVAAGKFLIAPARRAELNALVGRGMQYGVWTGITVVICGVLILLSRNGGLDVLPLEGQGWEHQVMMPYWLPIPFLSMTLGGALAVARGVLILRASQH